MVGSEAFVPGVGTDLVSVPRFAAALERGGDVLRARLFTAAERAACESGPRTAERLAVRFAAKEAALKALGTGWSGGLGFTDVEVTGGGGAAPRLRLHGPAAARAHAAGILELRVSLTHTEEFAHAVVVAVPLP
jgi:holo-[acyl-carrier protein] synthase